MVNGAIILVKEKKTTIFVEVQRVIRVKHYSIHMARSYCDQVRKFFAFHSMKQKIPFLDRHNFFSSIPCTLLFLYA